MAEESKPKWQGKVIVDVGSVGPEQVWTVLEDFCNLHKWIPKIDNCYYVEGVLGQPGLIRYCATNSTLKVDTAKSEPTINWTKEKLLTIDPVKKCLSYEVVDNNMGIKSYVATLKVLTNPINGDAKSAGCKIQWGFVCDPVEWRTSQDFKSYIESYIQFMAKKIELAYSVTGQS